MADNQPAEPDLPQKTEVELLHRIAEGDKDALSSLYDRFIRQVYSLSLRMVENQSLAEEVAQDVFMTVCSRGASYNSDRGSFISWLLSVTHKRCIDELRKRRRRARFATVGIDDVRFDIGGSADEVINAIFARLDREKITEALDKLPPPQKQVIVMAYFQGLTQSAISGVLGTPLGTVKTPMRLGLQKMRGLPATG